MKRAPTSFPLAMAPPRGSIEEEFGADYQYQVDVRRRLGVDMSPAAMSSLLGSMEDDLQRQIARRDADANNR